MVAGGDLHDTFLQGVITHPELQVKEWEGTSSLNDLKVVVEGTFVSLLLPGNTNETALRHQFPRFVAALDALSGSNMLNERPYFVSLTSALLRYKTKLPHSTRDLVTACLVKWLRMGCDISPETRLCSALHEALINLLNEVSINMLRLRTTQIIRRACLYTCSTRVAVVLTGKYRVTKGSASECCRRSNSCSCWL